MKSNLFLMFFLLLFLTACGTKESNYDIVLLQKAEQLAKTKTSETPIESPETIGGKLQQEVQLEVNQVVNILNEYVLLKVETDKVNQTYTEIDFWETYDILSLYEFTKVGSYTILEQLSERLKEEGFQTNLKRSGIVVSWF